MKFKNSVNAISLFANVGIAETYLDALGVKVKVANELVEERANFYRHLYPTVDMITGDITDTQVFERLVGLAQKKKVDFLFATPFAPRHLQ